MAVFPTRHTLLLQYPVVNFIYSFNITRTPVIQSQTVTISEFESLYKWDRVQGNPGAQRFNTIEINSIDN